MFSVTLQRKKEKVMNKVAVIVPLYKAELSPMEMMSMRQNYREFRDYPVIVVHPKGLELGEIRDEFPRLEFREFAPEFFHGIPGYNRFMMSEEFYAAFVDEYEYILICQTDVYIFRGSELNAWCEKGYDYVGAPWIKRDCYNMFPLKQWRAYRQWRKHCKGELCREDFWDKIGNGGLSLRRVIPHYEEAKNNRKKIEEYLASNKKFHAEDLYWGSEVDGFRYPDVEEALSFAFDKDPDYCFYRTKGKLPFGCHAWYRGENARFWLPMLGMQQFYKKTTRYPL